MPILAPPSFPTPDPVTTPATIRGLTILWHGWDGSEWNIGDDPTSGVRLMAGFRGLLFPELVEHTDEYAGVDGLTDRGIRAQAREVFMPIRVYHGDKSQAWIDYHRAFMRTMRPGKYGVLEIIQPGGESRRITLRLRDDGGPGFITDPALTGRQTYGFTMVAPQPFYEGAPVTVSFIPPTVGGPTFFDSSRFIASSFTYDSGQILNEGEVEAWVVWDISGGVADSVSVGLDGGVVTYPLPLEVTDRLVINTNPRSQSARKNGGSVTRFLTQREYRPVPPDGTSNLTINLVGGAATVSATITPLYWTGV